MVKSPKWTQMHSQNKIKSLYIQVNNTEMFLQFLQTLWLNLALGVTQNEHVYPFLESIVSSSGKKCKWANKLKQYTNKQPHKVHSKPHKF